MKITRLIVLSLVLTSGCVADQYYQLGQDLESTQPLAALEYYRLCLEADPVHEFARKRVVDVDFYEPLLQQAEGATKRGDHLAALFVYDQLVDMEAILRKVSGTPLPSSVDLVSRRAAAIQGASQSYFLEGEEFRNQDKAKQASKAYRRCLALDPTNARALSSYEEQKAAATLRIAVLLDCKTSGYQPWGRALADRVVQQAIKRQPEFLQFVDRNHLDALLDEHDLNESGLVDTSTASAQGKLLGLHSTIFGNLRVECRDTGWVETPGQNTVILQIREGDVIREVEEFASWVVYERQTQGIVSADYQVISVETGAIQAAVTDQTKSGSDVVKYARMVEGQIDAVPGNIRPLLDQAQREPQAPEDLASAQLPTLAAHLATKLVKQFR